MFTYSLAHTLSSKNKLKNGKIKDLFKTSWYLNGLLHREDGPAIEYGNGSTEWYINGQLHRINGPAKQSINGDFSWYLFGKKHREDGPAVNHFGNLEWFLYGTRHREDGPAILTTNGEYEWYCHGLLHRENGPAISTSVYSRTIEQWYFKGLRHRIDGPAIESISSIDIEWYLFGERSTAQECEQYRQQLLEKKQLFDTLHLHLTSNKKSSIKKI